VTRRGGIPPRRHELKRHRRHTEANWRDAVAYHSDDDTSRNEAKRQSLVRKASRVLTVTDAAKCGESDVISVRGGDEV
jgi:hypothetical protein